MHPPKKTEQIPAMILHGVMPAFTILFFAERSSSAIDALGAVRAARSTNRDKRGYSL